MTQFWTIDEFEQPTVTLPDWLLQQAGGEGFYLLAFALDGVIWGRIENGQLLTSTTQVDALDDVELTWDTLLRAYLFAPAGERQVWRDGERFATQVIDRATIAALVEEERVDERPLEEQYRLWGAAQDEPLQGFSLMQSGMQGLRHAPPLSLAEGQAAALQIEHYVAFDEEDQAYIAFSRLVDMVAVAGGA